VGVVFQKPDDRGAKKTAKVSYAIHQCNARGGRDAAEK
jgi:hypothetical protein